MDTTPYIIAGGQKGASRLNVLAAVLEPYTRTLLQRVCGDLSGLRALDVGCGGGNVTALLARLAGPAGSAHGVDFDPTVLVLAREQAAAQGVTNIRFEAGSATELAYDAAFDVVYSRFLLSHLQQPASAVQRLAAAAKPGRWVLVEDVQFSGHFCHPAHPSFEAYLRFYTETARNNGQHPDIGPDLPGLLEAAGLQDVGFDVVQPCFRSGPGKDLAWLTLDRIRDTVVAQGIAAPQEVANTLDALQDFTADASTIISLPRIFRAWGRKK